MSERKVPKLRFPEFSGEWVQSTIGKLCQVKTGAKDTQNKVEDGLYPFFVRSDNVERINSYSYDGEAILTAGDGVGVGKVFHYINGKFDYHQRVYNIHDFKNAYGRYVYYYFSNSFYNHVSKLSAKNSVDSVRRDMIVNMPISIPILEEQTEIADFLTNADEKIQQLTKKKELLEQYKKGVMRDVFSQKIRFKDDNGNDYPDWEEKILGDITDFLDGKRIPIKESERAKMSGKYPYYGASGIIDYINDFIFDQEIILLGEDGENIISRNLPLAFKVTGKCWVNNHAHVISPNHGVHIDYLTQYLEQLNYEKYNTGTAQPKLNQEICKNIDIKLPNLTEQTKIADFLTSLDDKITQVNMQLEQTKLFKKSLLQQIFI